MKRAVHKKKQEQIAINGKKLKIGVVVGTFHKDITDALAEGAVRVLTQHGVMKKNVRTMEVPGNFEVPLMCQRLARTKKYDALIAVGCVIKGGTDHYRYIAGEGIRGIMDVMLREDIPIGLSVLTTNTVLQAKDRCGTKEHAGESAARAVLSVLATKIK